MAEIVSKEKTVAEIDEILGWGIAVAPFVVAVTFSPLNFDYFGLPKLTSLYLVTLFLVYFQARKWFLTGRIRIPYSAIHALFGFVVFIALATASLSANPLASLFGRFNRYISLLAIICYAIISWFAFKNAKSKGFRDRFNVSFMVTFAVVNIYGLLEIFGLSALRTLFEAHDRTSSTFGNPVFFGGFLAISLPILLAKAMSPLQKSKFAWDNPLAHLSLFCFGLVMLFSTMSRGAWAGALAGVSVVAYLNLKSRHGNKILPRLPYLKLLLIGIIGLSLLLAATLVSVGGVKDLKDAKSLISLENRVEIWKSSILMISNRPLSGYGLDQAKDWFGIYMTKRLASLENALHDRAHDIYLQMFVDGGALYLLAQLWLFTYAIIKGIAHARRTGDYLIAGFTGAVIAYLTQGLTGIATNGQAVFTWFLMGAIAGTAAEKPFVLELKVIKPKLAGVFTTMAIAALTVAALFPLFAEARYFALFKEAEATSSKEVLEDAYRASKYLTMQPYYQLHFATLCLSFAREKEDISYAWIAVKTAKRGIRHAPDSPELYNVLGSSYLAIARETKDERYLEQADNYLGIALSKAPLFVGIHEDLLELYLQKGNYDKVIEHAWFVESVDSRNIRAYVIESIAYRAKGEDNKADKIYKKALSISPNAKMIRRNLIKNTIPDLDKNGE